MDGFNDKKVLVFGGCGFIGSNFIRLIFQQAPKVTVINFDKLTYSGNRENLADIEEKYHEAGQYFFVHGDIANKEQVDIAVQGYEPDYIINFAAETHVDRSIHGDQAEFFKTNIVGVYNILEVLKNRKWYGRFVQVSTDEVYGSLPNPHDIPAGKMVPVMVSQEGKGKYDMKSEKDLASELKFNRHTPMDPKSPYSATKAAGDCLCFAYYNTYGVPVVVTRCSNNYGPYQYPEKMIPFFATKLMKGEKIPMYGDGFQVRDWIHVDDHCRGLMTALFCGEPGQTYLFGADNERSNLEMAQFMVDVVVRDINGVYAPEYEAYLEFVKDRPGHDRRYAINSYATQKELMWKPQTTREQFFDKLKETILWYKDNWPWVEKIISKAKVNVHIK